MHAKELVSQIKEYNSHEAEIFDHSADLLLSNIRNNLEDIYNSGQWSMMIGVTQLGIALRKVSRDFKTFEIGILDAYPMHFGHTFHGDYPEIPSYRKFIDSGDYKNEEILGFQGEEIELLTPFLRALSYKGIGAYVDLDNDQLVFPLNIQ